jgi:hypothetical protein
MGTTEQVNGEWELVNGTHPKTPMVIEAPTIRHSPTPIHTYSNTTILSFGTFTL